MYASSNDLRSLPQSLSVPRFLTSAPLMFQFTGTPSSSSDRFDRLNYQTGASQFQGSVAAIQNPVTLQSFHLPGVPSREYGIFQGFTGSLQTSTVLAPAFTGIYSPFASSSVLGAPISNYTTPSSTVGMLPTITPRKMEPEVARMVLGELSSNVMSRSDQSNRESPWKLSRPMAENSFIDTHFDNPNITLSSHGEASPSFDQGLKRSLCKPRGELVGKRVNEIEDHLRRQTMSRISIANKPTSVQLK